MNMLQTIFTNFEGKHGATWLPVGVNRAVISDGVYIAWWWWWWARVGGHTTQQNIIFYQRKTMYRAVARHLMNLREWYQLQSTAGINLCDAEQDHAAITH
jgi:hypothetical protein